MDLKPLIRDVPDFPKPGITFKDITPLLADATALRTVVNTIAETWAGASIDVVAGIEARGFLLAAPVAYCLGVGLVPIRKPGKLPWKCYEESYQLEYGSDRIQLHVDAATPKDRVLLVDDVLATGGTMTAALRLVRRTGATVVGAAFLVDLAFLGGFKKLDTPIFSLMRYE